MRRVRWYNLREDQKVKRIEKAITLLPESLLRDNAASILKQYSEDRKEGVMETLRLLILEEVGLHWKEDKSKKKMLEVLCDGMAR